MIISPGRVGSRNHGVYLLDLQRSVKPLAIGMHSALRTGIMKKSLLTLTFICFLGSAQADGFFDNLRDLIDRFKPDHAHGLFKGFELSDELKELQNEYKDSRRDLSSALKDALKDLGKDATREERMAVIESFKEDNADLIAEQKERRDQIVEAIKEAREAGLSDEAKELLQQMKTLSNEFKEARASLREKLDGATKEERRVILSSFRDEQKAALEELREARRALKEEIRGRTADGEHRGE